MINKKQEEAIHHIDSPLCILAGPGTGKTKTLEEKIKHLILQNVPPEHILAMTFTNSAATELITRIHKKVNIHTYKLNIGTFHSQCLKILQRHPEEAHLKEGFTWLTAEKQEKRIAKILNELDITWNQNYLPSIRETLSTAKKQQKWADIPTYSQALAKEIYSIYQYYLRVNNEIDFDDMIIKTNFIFKETPELLKIYQQQYKHILIDEAQDMDTTQYQFLRHLKCQNTTVAGDDDQNIYEFKGSDPKYIQTFIDEWNAKVITLNQNYRNSLTILSASQAQIKNNKNRIDKEIETKNNHGSKIKILVSPDETKEAEQVAKLIQNKPNCAILYRRNEQSKPFENEFQKKGIPYKIIDGIGFYEKKEIKDAIAVITLTYNDDAIAFQQMMQCQHGIGPKTTDKLLQHANTTNTQLIECLDQKLTGITSEQHEMLKFIKKTYKQKNLYEIIRNLVQPKEPYRQDNIEKLIKNMRQWTKSTREFIEHVRHLETNPKTVKMGTFHKSKGMQFDNIVITGYEEGIIPHSNTVYEENKASEEEERRLSYVALTRASKEIVISYTKSRQLSNKRTSQQPSQFLEEIPDEYKEYI